jgi:hypothetical protein
VSETAAREVVPGDTRPRAVADHRRILTEIHGGTEYVQRLVEAAPPLTIERKSRLAELLRD